MSEDLDVVLVVDDAAVRGALKFLLEVEGLTVALSDSLAAASDDPKLTHCRCIVVTFLVPEASKRRLRGIESDYKALKADISAYMRNFTVADLEGRGQRHAAEFVSEALATNSPKTLTKRFLKRSNYFLP